MPTLLLLLMAAGMGVEIVDGGAWCRHHAAAVGSYDPQRSEVAFCTERIKANGRSIGEVARHELFHAVQHQFGRDGRSFLSDGQITSLVHRFMDDREVMAVISVYPSDEINSELEARLVSRLLPNEAIGGMLLAARVIQQAPQQGLLGSLRAYVMGGSPLRQNKAI